MQGVSRTHRKRSGHTGDNFDIAETLLAMIASIAVYEHKPYMRVKLCTCCLLCCWCVIRRDKIRRDAITRDAFRRQQMTRQAEGREVAVDLNNTMHC